MNTRGTIFVAGAIARRGAGYGGHAWVFLQYLLGFRRLGWDVVFIDTIEAHACRDDAGRPCDVASSRELKYLRDVMAGFGLGDRFALLTDSGAPRCFGMTREMLLDHASRAAMLLNVMGYLRDDEIISRVRGPRVFLDIDPGFPQMWRELGLHDALAGHDAFVTVGQNVGRPGCDVPPCGVEWITTLPPVVLEQWPVTPAPGPMGNGHGGGSGFTTVGSWRGPFAPVEFRGRTYGLRVHEFRRFVDLPKRTKLPFDVALDIDPSDAQDLAALLERGWRLNHPKSVARDPQTYRGFVRRSAAEVCVAKNMYVRSRGGWFSDRSACYLASGRPVLAQDTGFEAWYQGSDGLVPFATPDEAVDGARRIADDYERHCRAARALAEERFDSDKVLGRLLNRLDVG